MWRSTAPARGGQSIPAARRSTRPRLRRSRPDARFAVLVVAKRFEGQRAERGLLVGKHRRHLLLRRAVDARVRPARLPAIQVRLRRGERLEAQPFERCFLCVADAGFDFAFPIGIADAARKRDDAIMREHIAVERIERRVVDVRREDALAQVVEDNDLDRPAQLTEGALVQLGPDLRARPPHQQAHRFAGVAECEDEEPRPPVLPRVGVADHGALPVIHLAFFTSGGGNHDPRDGGRAGAEPHDEAAHTGVAGREAVVVD